MERPTEVRDYHTRLLKFSLEIEHCRAYWRYRPEAELSQMPQRAFADYWFGARSLPRVRLLLASFRERFDRFPPALSVLHRWDSIDSTTRRLICHWHLQLADPLYREFTGTYLADRTASGRIDVTRDTVVRRLETLVPARWATATRIQFARKLLLAYSEKLGYRIQSTAGEEWEREKREMRAPREAISEIVRDALKMVMEKPERPMFKRRPFPWAALFSDGKALDDEKLLRPKEEAFVCLDFRFVPDDEHGGSTWIQRSDESQLWDRLIWVCGDSSELTARARTLVRSKSMVQAWCGSSAPAGIRLPNSDACCCSSKRCGSKRWKRK